MGEREEGERDSDCVLRPGTVGDCAFVYALIIYTIHDRDEFKSRGWGAEK